MTPVRAQAAADAPSGAGEALPLGTRLDEFELRRVLGVGGFGIVYLAWDHALEREVALKEYMPITLAARGAHGHVTLRTASDADTFTTGMRSFVNEARLLARFDHPGLVKVHRFWEGNGTAYMVMPFYRGRTLRQVRQAMTQPPDEAQCRRLIDPLLSALELLHSEAVFHRDIAPDNILVGDDGAPVLLDFGAARRVVSSTPSVTAIVKPNFAPLEQYDVSGLRQGPWTDLYALGATVYHFLTGRAPPPAVSRTLCDEVKPLAAQGAAGCSAAFLRAIDWMLALAPQNRPQDVASLRAALDGRLATPVAIVAPAVPQGVAANDEHSRAMAPTVALSPASTDFDPTQPMPKTPVATAKPARRSMGIWVAVAGAVVLAGAIAWALKPAPAKKIEAKPPAAMRSAVPVRAVTLPPEEPRRMEERRTEEPRRTADIAPARRPLPVHHPAPPTAAPVEKRAIEESPPVTVAGPRERCGERMLLTQIICVKRECLRPANRGHPDCLRLEEMERDARMRQEQREP